MSEDVAQDQNPKFVRVNSRLHSFGRGRSYLYNRTEYQPYIGTSLFHNV